MVHVNKTECTEDTEDTEDTDCGDSEPWSYVLVTAPVNKILLPPIPICIKNYACTEAIQRQAQTVVKKGALLTEVCIRNQYRHFLYHMLLLEEFLQRNFNERKCDSAIVVLEKQICYVNTVLEDAIYASSAFLSHQHNICITNRMKQSF